MKPTQKHRQGCNREYGLDRHCPRCLELIKIKLRKRAIMKHTPKIKKSLPLHYYDRQGNPISMKEWAKKFNDRTYQRVIETVLSDGKWVSTVWLGLNHNYGDSPSLIFETMVFPSKKNFGDLDCQRYSSKEEALVGHKAMVKKWQKEIRP